MGYMFLTAPCFVCGQLFTRNPHRVPAYQGEPICHDCIMLVNEQQEQPLNSDRVDALCAICGKPPSSYLHWLLSQGKGYHVGCLASAYQEIKAAHSRLFDKLVASGFYGPWSDDWEGSYEAAHWGGTSDL